MSLTRVPSFLLKDPQFTDLKDTPASYAGHGGKPVFVKTDETGLEFRTAPNGGGSGDVVGAENVGTGHGIFTSKEDALLKFKTLKAGPNVTISESDEEITISAAGGSGGSSGGSPGYRVVTGFTAADIQAAINSIGTSGGTVFLPEGTYNLNATIVLPVKVNGASIVRLKGAGEGTVLQPSTNLTALIRVEGSFAGVEDMRFVNVASRAQRAIQFGVLGTTTGLQGNEGLHTYVERCWFESFPAALYCWDYMSIYAQKNFFVACTTSLRCEENGMGSKFTHNYILGGGPCLYFEVAADNAPNDGIISQQAEGVYITHNDIHPTNGHGIVFNGGLHFTIADNMIGEVTKFPDGNPAFGVFLDGRTNPVAFGTIDRNWIGGAWENYNGSRIPKGTSGVVLTAGSSVVRDVKIRNNTFAGFSAYGVSLDGKNVWDCKVCENKFQLIFTADLSINAAGRTLVFGNTFDNEAGTYSIIEHVPSTGEPSNSTVIGNIIWTEKTKDSNGNGGGPKTLTKSKRSIYMNNYGDDTPLYTYGDFSLGGGKVRGCLVYRNADLNIPDQSWTPVPWEIPAYDTDGVFVSGSANIVTPSWARLARVRASAGFPITNTAGLRQVAIKRNGSDAFLGGSTGITQAAWSAVPTAETGWVPTSPGDIWTTDVYHNAGTIVPLRGIGNAQGSRTWMQVEFA